MVTPHGTSQAVYKAHIQFGQDQPDAMKIALDAINRWGRQEVTLAQGIAESVIEAYKAGIEGANLLPVRLAPRVIRRTPPAVAEPAPITRMRRTR